LFAQLRLLLSFHSCLFFQREQTRQKSITAENQLAARLKAAQETQRALDEAERDIHLLDAEQDYLQSLLLLKEDEGMSQLVRAASLTARQSVLMLTRLPSSGPDGSAPAPSAGSPSNSMLQQILPAEISNSSINLGAEAPGPALAAAIAVDVAGSDN
jgi:hypothetical protein